MARWFAGWLGGSGMRASERDPGDDFWYRPVARASASGVSVTVERALQVPVVYACVKVLSESVAQLPVKVFERRDNGDKRPAESHPLYDLVHRFPNRRTTAFEFWGQAVWDLATEGNFIAEKVAGPRGFVDQLIRHDWCNVTVERLSDGSAAYRVRMDDGSERRLLDDEVFHLKALPLRNNGLCGTSPVEVGREAIGAAIAVQDFGSRFFQNDCTPPYVIEHPGNFKDDESKKNFLKAIKRWWGGSNKGTPAVMEYGMKMSKLGNTNEESQFLDTRKENDYSVARLWRMPPHKVGLMDKATFSNIEQQSIEFVIDTLLPWLRLIEQGIARDLLLAPNRYFVEFNVAGLLRGDIKARYEAYAIGRNWGWLSVNDIRKFENMNSIGDQGDRYVVPLNMTDAQGDGQPAPAAPEPAPRRNGALNGYGREHLDA